MQRRPSFFFSGSLCTLPPDNGPCLSELEDALSPSKKSGLTPGCLNYLTDIQRSCSVRNTSSNFEDCTYVCSKFTLPFLFQSQLLCSFWAFLLFFCAETPRVLSFDRSGRHLGWFGEQKLGRRHTKPIVGFARRIIQNAVSIENSLLTKVSHDEAKEVSLLLLAGNIENLMSHWNLL